MPNKIGETISSGDINERLSQVHEATSIMAAIIYNLGYFNPTKPPVAEQALPNYDQNLSREFNVITDNKPSEPESPSEENPFAHIFDLIEEAKNNREGING